MPINCGNRQCGNWDWLARHNCLDWRPDEKCGFELYKPDSGTVHLGKKICRLETKPMSKTVGGIAEGSMVQSEGGGRKADSGKARWDLLPWGEVKEVVEVLTFGARKYDDNNWKKVTEKFRYVGAAMRHFTAYLMGEKKDPETGLSHLAHCVCCLLFLMWHEKQEEV